MIIVTGAFGFIGSHLVERLLDMGEEVVAAGVAFSEDNLPYILRHRNASKLRVSYVDFTSFQQVKALLDTTRPETVYHLAAVASHRLSRKDPFLYLGNNYNSLLAVLEAARLLEPSPKVVYTSSSSVYGDNAPPLSEEMNPRPKGPYALSKYLGEQLCRLYYEEYRVECPIIRYFNVVGERCRENIVFRVFAERILRGEPIEVYGRFENGVFRPAERDFTYVSDAVEGTILVGVRGAGCEVFNIGAGKPVSVLRIAELMMERLGRRIDVRFKELQPHESLVSYSSNAKAREKLGWAPKTNVEEMVDRFARWVTGAVTVR
ncbi:MAG: GDP-mannose 4,6-dehydratase [Nitrososphaerota archaeon]|nr:GDP-mannose 4,6-dehydratase [Candidatus Calditenuaceae archaeon]MDW8073630.1 GDP-mannose 4,6-dehydratase [Nitrososphaerota archaeon]